MVIIQVFTKKISFLKKNRTSLLMWFNCRNINDILLYKLVIWWHSLNLTDISRCFVFLCFHIYCSDMIGLNLMSLSVLMFVILTSISKFFLASVTSADYVINFSYFGNFSRFYKKKEKFHNFSKLYNYFYF